MTKRRVVVLAHTDLVPPESLDGYTEEQIAEWKTEFDVCSTLREHGHDVRCIGLRDELGELRETLLGWKPHVAFNLLEEFHSVATYDQHVVSYLELMRQPYTGCNPRGLLLAHDKALTKQILTHHRIRTPRFAEFPRNRKVRPTKSLRYPLFVKSSVEEASAGISQASIVRDEAALIERVQFIHDSVGSDALVEEFIEGREIYVGVLGNQRLQTLQPWEMYFGSMPEDLPHIATRQVKWNARYQKKYGITTGPAKGLDADLETKLARICRRVYKALRLSGYARIDLRLREDGRIYILEANPNPNLSFGEDFAESAEKDGIPYPKLLERILSLGASYRAEWKA